MGLNSAGIDAMLNDGNEAVVWVGIGSGPTSGDQTSAARQQFVMAAPSGGVINGTGTPYAFTGTPGAGATHALFFSAAAAGTFYGFKALSGAQVFDASGNYLITSAAITGSSS